MVLVYSNDTDWSTNDVLLWINYFGGSFKRVSINKAIKTNEFSISINDNNKLSASYKSNELLNNKFDSIWFRRTDGENQMEIDNKKYYQASSKIKTLVHNELKYTRKAFYNLNNKTNWLTHPDIVHTDKLDALMNLRECGLVIPETIITNNKKDLISFKKKNGRIIIKPVFNMEEIVIDNKKFLQYTTEITNQIINKLPDVFFPCLFQKLIIKEMEIRTFVLSNKSYSMAIFSQNDSSTTVDFRNKQIENRNKTVPYKLPKEVEKKIQKFMKMMKMNNGSIDIIKTKDNNYIFLEINAVGQFGMVSFPCNYFLEREIANTLLK